MPLGAVYTASYLTIALPKENSRTTPRGSQRSAPARFVTSKSGGQLSRDIFQNHHANRIATTFLQRCGGNSFSQCAIPTVSMENQVGLSPRESITLKATAYRTLSDRLMS